MSSMSRVCPPFAHANTTDPFVPKRLGRAALSFLPPHHPAIVFGPLTARQLLTRCAAKTFEIEAIVPQSCDRAPFPPYSSCHDQGGLVVIGLIPSLQIGQLQKKHFFFWLVTAGPRPPQRKRITSPRKRADDKYYVYDDTISAASPLLLLSLSLLHCRFAPLVLPRAFAGVFVPLRFRRSCLCHKILLVLSI